MLNTSTASGSNNANLTQDTYVQNTSYRDEWIFIYDYCNMYIGAQNGDPLMLPILSAVHNQFSSNGYFGFGYTDLTKPQLHQQWGRIRIFSCITHGAYDRIRLGTSRYEISDIEGMDSTYMNSLQFVYYGACETGKGGSSAENLVNVTKAKGVDIVLGFTTEVLIDETNFWSEELMKNIASGLSVGNSIAQADEAMRNDPTFGARSSYSISNRLLQGSASTVLCP